MRLIILSFVCTLTACDQTTLSCNEDRSAVQECDADGNCEIVDDCASLGKDCYPNLHDGNADPYCMEEATLEE